MFSHPNPEVRGYRLCMGGLIACGLISGVFMLHQAVRIGSTQRLFRDVLDTNYNGVIVCDGTKVVYANEAAEEITGYSISELVGADVSILVPNEYIDEHNAGVREAMSRATDAPRIALMILPIKKKHGEIVKYRAQVSSVRRVGHVTLVTRIERLFAVPTEDFRDATHSTSDDELRTSSQRPNINQGSSLAMFIWDRYVHDQVWGR